MIDATSYDGWEYIKDLGEGNQGRVYLVRSPGDAKSRKQLIETMLDATKIYAGISDKRQMVKENFATALTNFLKSESNPNVGALKQMNIKPGDDGRKALERFEKEITALSENTNPALLKLLHKNLEKRFMVTEYHSGGTLAAKLNLFKGNAFAALSALRPVVSAVAELHSKVTFHRDIKSQNIFLAADGRLVLGDFGIVFNPDNDEKRLTETYERVGSRDWMPPWCVTGRRIEDVRSSCDIFALGKVLWVMISGERMLPFWYHPHSEFDLEGLFPNEPAMKHVNSLLDRCVVENERDCLSSSKELLALIDTTIRQIKLGAHTPKLNVSWLCRVCGVGQYRGGDHDRFLPAPQRSDIRDILTLGQLIDVENRYTVRILACDNCGHMEMFHFADGKQPKGWLS
jgi:serine/threonine protein kinase